MHNDIKKLIQSIKLKSKISDVNLAKVKGVLEQASERYYNTEEEIMSDEEFDTLLREFKRLGGTIEVGAFPAKGKGLIEIEHSFNELVGTLDKTNFVYQKDVNEDTKKSIEEWIRNVMKKVTSPISVGISFKFDGNSVVIEYNNGKIVQALTRGRNGLGMDLTHVFKDHTIKDKSHVGVKYEIIIPWEKYTQLMKDTGVSYANPRSLVSGKLGDDNAYQFYKYMELVPLWVKPHDSFMSRLDQLDFIEESFSEDNSLFMDYRILEDINNTEESISYFLSQLNEMYESYTSDRYDLPFMIDGLVIEVMEQEARDTLGYANDEPNWATALKFPYMEKKTKIVDFDYTLGDSGVITSRAWFEPVEFNGTIHNKQSLQNYRRYNELGLGIGSEILVQYRNDCLTYLVGIQSPENSKIEAHPYIDHCPVCNGEVGITETGAFAFCANPLCEGKVVGRIQNYLTKMDIKGIKESTITKLRDAGIVSHIPDLYKLDFESISSVEGLGEITAINIMGAVQGKVPYDYEILGALGITSLSTSKAKELCKVFTLQEMLDLSEIDPVELSNKVINVEGFSDIIAGKLLAGLEDNKETIIFLLAKEHKVYRDFAKKFANVESLKIVFTNFRDEVLQSKLEMLGHKITSAVSSKTNLVVCPDPNGTTVKIKKAKDLGIRVLTVEDFKKEMDLE